MNTLPEIFERIANTHPRVTTILNKSLDSNYNIVLHMLSVMKSAKLCLDFFISQGCSCKNQECKICWSRHVSGCISDMIVSFSDKPLDNYEMSGKAYALSMLRTISEGDTYKEKLNLLTAMLIKTEEEINAQD